jgi:1,4-alpha-glucan branching enzyme
MAPTSDAELKFLISFPQADSVCAIGEFNNWSTVATPLTKIGDDKWELRLPSHAELERLSFFVIPQGARIGRLIRQKVVANA